MKKTVFYNPEIPYSLHDMNVIEFEVNGDNLIMRTQSGMVRTAPNWDQVDGYLEFLDVNWEYCYATVCDGYYGNLGTYEGKSFKKMHLKDFIAEFHNAGFSIMDEYYGQDRALYTGYFSKGGTMGECTIEIYHNNIVFYEQTDDTREMKEVVLSADGDLSLYLVPADVADKAFAYFRVGNAEQLGETTDNRVFLYCRQSYDDSHFMNQQQEHLLRHCADKGYQAAGSTAVVASAKDEKENMLRLAERLKSDGIKTMLISDPSRISLDPQDFIEIVSAFHKNGVTIEYQDGDGNTRNLLEVLEQLRTANLNLAEPEHDEDEEQDESPRIQM